MQGGASTGAERTGSYVSTGAQRQRSRWPLMDRLLLAGLGAVRAAITVDAQIVAVGVLHRLSAERALRPVPLRNHQGRKFKLFLLVVGHGGLLHARPF